MRPLKLQLKYFIEKNTKNTYLTFKISRSNCCDYASYSNSKVKYRSSDLRMNALPRVYAHIMLQEKCDGGAFILKLYDVYYYVFCDSKRQTYCDSIRRSIEGNI